MPQDEMPHCCTKLASGATWYEDDDMPHMLFPSPHVAMDVMCEDVYMPSYASGVGRGWLSFVWMAPHQCVHVRGLGVIFYGAGAVPDEWF